MPQSLVKNYIHITFSTKHRENLITKDIQDELFNYLGGICRDLEYFPVIVGGYLDHAHFMSSFKEVTFDETMITPLRGLMNNRHIRAQSPAKVEGLCPQEVIILK